jgi:hypothetical protein
MISYTSTLAVLHLFRYGGMGAPLSMVRGEFVAGQVHLPQPQPEIWQDSVSVAGGGDCSVFVATTFFFDGFGCRNFRWLRDVCRFMFFAPPEE